MSKTTTYKYQLTLEVDQDMKKHFIALTIAITSSLLMTACGNKNDTVSAMNNVSTEIESNIESSTEKESSIEVETQTQSNNESTIETESQDGTESTIETEISSVAGEETETTEVTEIDESKISDAVGEVNIDEYKAGDVQENAFTITDMDATMYATQQCNIRIQPSTQNDVIGSLLQTQEIHVTGKVNEVNWYRISLSDGTEGYVSAGLLSSTKPAVQITTPTPSTAQEAATQADQPLTPDQVINPNTGEPLKPGDVLPNGLTYIGEITKDANGNQVAPDGSVFHRGGK